MERNDYLKFQSLEKITIIILRIILSYISLWVYMLFYIVYIIFHILQLFPYWFSLIL